MMGLFSKFLNPNAMTDDKIIQFAHDIVNNECQGEIRNIVNGMIQMENFHKYVRNGGEPNDFIDFMREFTNVLDRDDVSLQNKAHFFSGTYANDLRVTTRSHPIIKLYSLIIDLNTCCKNYSICEYEVLEAIFNAKSEAEATRQVSYIREKSNAFFRDSEIKMKTVMEIMDNPRKVLYL